MSHFLNMGWRKKKFNWNAGSQVVKDWL